MDGYRHNDGHWRSVLKVLCLDLSAAAASGALETSGAQAAQKSVISLDGAPRIVS
jgi:hypothetical protein